VALQNFAFRGRSEVAVVVEQVLVLFESLGKALGLILGRL
jgi:hypothetical protein